MWPQQCQVQMDNPFPGPAGHIIVDPGQDAICLLGHLGTAGSCSASYPPKQIN